MGRGSNWKAMLCFILGLLVAGVLFWLGDMDDAPGLSFIGLAAGFLLVMRGIYHTKIIKAGHHIPIILCVFGAVGILFPIVLYLDGELEGLPMVAVIGNVFGIFMILLALKLLKNK